jgi:hypothetical protein
VQVGKADRLAVRPSRTRRCDHDHEAGESRGAGHGDHEPPMPNPNPPGRMFQPPQRRVKSLSVLASSLDATPVHYVVLRSVDL